MTINIGKTREVFWDDYLIDTEKTTAARRLNTLTKRESVFTFDQGNELYGVSYPQILKTEDGYRMYYITWNPCLGEGHLGIKWNVIESKDGLTWERPALDIYDAPELETNNVVLDNVEDNMFVFCDTNPACPPEERYKAIGREAPIKEKPELWCYVSPDGYHFKRSHLVTKSGYFDTLNTAFYKDGKYYCYIRSFHNFVEGEIATRDIRVLYSEDFRTWSEPTELKYSDDLDYDMYTNNVMPYERAPHILIGMPTRYVRRHGWTKNLEQMNSYEHKKKVAGDIELRVALHTTDAIFMCSRDSVNWTRFNEALLTPGYETENNWVYGDCYISYNPVDSGAENYWVYDMDNVRGLNSPRNISRYEIRKDGFAYMEARSEEKILTTKPFTFEGSSLHINFETSPFGHIYVDVLDEEGNVLKGESTEIFGNNIDRVVYFGDECDLSEFAGKSIRLRFRMLDAKLYSLIFE